ncbi:uncharacterized protein LOC126458098 [Schistocerca serialis cubense]|uniref:uncharacterized protein LOC126458098 n=2 Tax=Schistocerca TaxID=7008 RepID=UPI00214F5A55|nr:uncharacterized protein LOC126458098 [Schistocerca serialis cubense]
MISSTAAARVDTVHLLLFDSCLACHKMSAFPQGMHAAYKVRSNLQKYESMTKADRQSSFSSSSTDNSGSGNYPHMGNKFMEELPTKYNDKLMKSIWGFYNRYSVHNLKTIEDGNVSKSQQ